MIFHEIYSVYYNAVTQVLQAAAGGKIVNRDLISKVSKQLKMSEDARELIEAGLETVPNTIIIKPFNFFNEDRTPRIAHCPEIPLTIIEKRWLKTILDNPRIQLFDISCEGLEDVEPFYLPEDFVVFDREGDGDPWNDDNYVRHFRTILAAMQNKQNIHISWLSRESLVCEAVCRPDKFEYSELDDRMRLWADTNDSQIKITLARVQSCEISSEPLGLSFPPELLKPLPTSGFRQQEKERRSNLSNDDKKSPNRLVLEITNENNALERTLFHFSHFQKQDIVSLGENRYRLVMSIDYDDREELVNRVISFGPYLRVVEPQWLIAKVLERLQKQMQIMES